MERVETDDDDRPTQPIKILKATIFVNPYKEMEEAEKKEEEQKRLEVIPCPYSWSFLWPSTHLNHVNF